MRNDFDPYKFGPDDAPDTILICDHCKSLYSSDQTGKSEGDVCEYCEDNGEKTYTTQFGETYTNTELIAQGERRLSVYEVPDYND